MVDSEHVPRLAREFDYRGTASYPKPRYCDPIVIDLDYYQWLAVAGMPNVSEKTLGTFTERQCAVSQVELGRGANHRVGSCSVYLVLWGAGLCGTGRTASTPRCTSTTAKRPKWRRATIGKSCAWF